MTADSALPAETRIGHVHLKVADLERAIGFYRDLLGFDLLMNLGSAAFLSVGSYHHHIGLTPLALADGAGMTGQGQISPALGSAPDKAGVRRQAWVVRQPHPPTDRFCIGAKTERVTLLPGRAAEARMG